MILCIKSITNENLLRELYSALCGDLNSKEIQKRRDTCIHMADSFCCTEETQHCKATMLRLKLILKTYK